MINEFLDKLKFTDEEIGKLVNEVFDNSDDTDIKFDKETVASFEVAGMKYKCEFTESLTENHKKIMEFKFKLLNSPKKLKRDNFQTDHQYQIALNNSQIGITNTGNPFKVFGKVIIALQKYIENNKPDYITFNAEEENRQKLYDSLLKLLSKRIPEYIRLSNHPLMDYELSEGEFWLERIK